MTDEELEPFVNKLVAITFVNKKEPITGKLCCEMHNYDCYYYIFQTSCDYTVFCETNDYFTASIVKDIKLFKLAANGKESKIGENSKIPTLKIFIGKKEANADGIIYAINKGLPIPQEWIDEYNNLIKGEDKQCTK